MEQIPVPGEWIRNPKGECGVITQVTLCEGQLGHFSFSMKTHKGYLVGCTSAWMKSEGYQVISPTPEMRMLNQIFGLPIHEPTNGSVRVEVCIP